MSWIRHKRGQGYRCEDREAEPNAEGKRPTFAVGPWRERKADAVDDQKAHDAKVARLKQATGSARPNTPIAALLDRWVAGRKAKGKGSDADNALVRWATERIAGVVAALADGADVKAVDAWVEKHPDAHKAVTIPDITADAVDRWMTAHPYGARRRVRAMMRFLRWAAGAPGIPHDPQLAHLELPTTRRRKQPDALSDKQVAEILLRAYEAGGTSVGVAIEHLVLYGCRPKDIVRARVSAVGADGSITYVDTKNGDDISHPCHREHGRKLLRLAKGRARTAPLFLDPWGREWRLSKDQASAGGLNSWYRNNVTKPMVKAGTLTKAQVGIYCLKDYALRRLTLAARGDRKAVATVSGHRDPSVIDRYLPHSAETQRALIMSVGFAPTGEVAEAAAADDLAIEPIPDVMPAAKLLPYRQQPGKVRRGFAAMSPETRAAMEAKRVAAIRASKAHRRMTPEQARAAQLKSAEARKRNAEARRAAAKGDAA